MQFFPMIHWRISFIFTHDWLTNFNIVFPLTGTFCPFFLGPINQRISLLFLTDCRILWFFFFREWNEFLVALLAADFTIFSFYRWTNFAVFSYDQLEKNMDFFQWLFDKFRISFTNRLKNFANFSYDRLTNCARFSRDWFMDFAIFPN